MTSTDSTARNPNRHDSTRVRAGFRVIWVLAVVLSIAMPAAAQAPAAPAAATPTVATRPLYFEVFIVIVMAGVSLYAVCRSSRRN